MPLFAPVYAPYSIRSNGARRWIAAALLTLAALNGQDARAETELVMYEASDCPWCETWHSEVGSVFKRTTEARKISLRVVDVDDPTPDDLKHIQGIVYTPTFVVVDDGKELGRILGYPGEDFFWGLLQVILRKIPDRTEAAAQ